MIFVSWRTSLLRGGRSLRDLCTPSVTLPLVGEDDCADQREDLCRSFLKTGIHVTK